MKLKQNEWLLKSVVGDVPRHVSIKMEIFNHTASGLSVYVTHKKGRPYMTYSFNEENMIEYSLLKDKDINFDELSIEMTRKFLMMAVHSSYLRVNNFSGVIEDMLKICQLSLYLQKHCHVKYKFFSLRKQ